MSEGIEIASLKGEEPEIVSVTLPTGLSLTIQSSKLKIDDLIKKAVSLKEELEKPSTKKKGGMIN